MNTRLRYIVTTALAAGIVAGCGFGADRVITTAQAAGATPTATETITPTPTATPPGGATPTVTSTPTAAHPTLTPTRIRPKPFVRNPTPIPARRKQLTLPPPVVVVVGSKVQGQGLSQTKALALANTFVPQLLLQAPTYVPKHFVLQFIQVDPAQGTGSPTDAYLQYVPKGLTKAGGTYPSFYITKQIGLEPIILPGAKIQSVIVNKGVQGAGVVTGTVVDFKPKNGAEVVHVVWTRLTVTYDVSSTIGVSKLSIKDLLAVAATVQ